MQIRGTFSIGLGAIGLAWLLSLGSARSGGIVATVNYQGKEQIITGEMQMDAAANRSSGQAAVTTRTHPASPLDRRDGSAVAGRFEVKLEFAGSCSGDMFGTVGGTVRIEGKFKDDQGAESEVAGEGSYTGAVSSTIGIVRVRCEWPQVTVRDPEIVSPIELAVIIPFNFKPELQNVELAENAPTPWVQPAVAAAAGRGAEQSVPGPSQEIGSALAARASSPPVSAAAQPASVPRAPSSPAGLISLRSITGIILTVKTPAVRMGERIVVVHSPLSKGQTNVNAWIGFYRDESDQDSEYISYTFLRNLTDRVYDVDAPKEPGKKYHFRIFLDAGYNAAARSDFVEVK